MTGLRMSMRPGAAFSHQSCETETLVKPHRTLLGEGFCNRYSKYIFLENYGTVL